MSNLFTNHRLNRCETVQVKLADLGKPAVKTLQVQVKSLNACKPSRISYFIDPRHGRKDAEVLIVTKSDIRKLRRNGYEVEVVQKYPGFCPTVDPVEFRGPTVKPIGPHGIGTTTFGVSNGITGFGGISVCCSSNGKPKGKGGLLHTTSNGRCARAADMVIPKSRRQQLLERYIILVKKHRELTQELDDYGRELAAALPNDDMTAPTYNLFRPFVDENKLSDSFHSIFQKFFGVLPTERLEGDYKSKIDLIAYFFILVEWEKLGNYTFSEKCKKPFFEFVNEKVLIEKLDVTERTFHNRLTRTMDEFRKNLAKEPLTSKFKGDSWKRDRFINDFLKVLEIFHATEYYKELEVRKHA